MKNLFTILLLIVSFLAVGQTNNITEEIKYWKSIADSNDTVAYRQYLNRYGETGLYYDEAITRITLLKTSGKHTQTRSTECYFYYIPYEGNHSIVKFDSSQNKVWIKRNDYNTIQSNLVLSKDFYENQATIAMSRKSINLMAQVTSSSISGKITDSNRSALAGATIVATHTPSGAQYYSVADAKGNYHLLNIRPGGPYKIEFRMVGFQNVIQNGVSATPGETKILNVRLNKAHGKVFIVADTISPKPEDYKYAWTADEEYEYDPMKSTSARDVYFKRDKLYEIKYYPKRHYDDPYYDNNLFKSGTSYKYDNSFDENNYKDNEYFSYNIKTMQGYRYVAFSKDKSSIIMWFEEDNKYNNGKIQNKEEYTRKSKESFLPKPVNNYDFLNE